MTNRQYKHLSQRDQILKRPAQHIGSTKNAKQVVWLAEKQEEWIIYQKEINYNTGLIHIFYEVLSNAQDNYFNSVKSKHPLKKIKVDVTEDGWISVWNDGLWIPTRIHEYGKDEEHLDGEHYEAELLFGHLNSSGNYNDDQQERIGAGLHGHGVKLTNIFSSEFQVETYDPQEKKKFVQKFSGNMGKRSKPKITELKSDKGGYTKVSYKADFEKFHLTGYSEELICVIKKLTLDCAMITGVNVYFNNEKLNIKDLNAYSKLYVRENTEDECIEFKTKDSHVILRSKQTVVDSHTNHISFVNGILTNKGGVHVSGWYDAILKPLSDMIRKKFCGKNNLASRFTKGNLQDYFVMFVKCNLPNPEFEGQTKQILAHPRPTIQASLTKIKKLMTWTFIREIEELVLSLNTKELQKTDGKKTLTVHVPKTDDANKAGTKLSKQCTLFITEGDSAKAFAIKGISCLKNGRDFYGVMPAKGKILNVRSASAKEVNNNDEISNLKKLLGLKHGLDYTKPENIETLRYGKLRILTDQDHDGNHIKGLIFNFFDRFFPTLLKTTLIDGLFMNGLKTPIVRVAQGKKHYNFYYMNDYKKWVEQHQHEKYTAKYYKGLGTWKDKDIVELFQDPLYVQYFADGEMSNTIDLMFNKDRVKERKVLLTNHKPAEFVYSSKNGQEIVPITDFIYNEMIEFSMYDNIRSIPNMIDGFKPSQRKALWVGLHKLSTTQEYKVAQFSGEVAKLSEYHHGEESMQKTIIKMAQTFVGSNNIAFFKEEGQFGTRLEGGKDHASARYIFIMLEKITRKIFREEDDPILIYNEEEGREIEPKYFLPIIPTLFVNGGKGVGTGFSTNIPSYNPLELVQWIRTWLWNKASSNKKEQQELLPWYWGFKGNVYKKGNTVYYEGIVEPEGNDVYHIKELPVKTWTTDYKDKVLIPLKEKKEIQKWNEYSSAYDVSIKVYSKKKIDAKTSKYKLVSSENLSNMNAFNSEESLVEYKNIQEMLHDYCNVRLDGYKKRKTYFLKQLNTKLSELESKMKFIQAVLKNSALLKWTEEKLESMFEKEHYVKKNNTYTYLLDIPFRNFTPKKVEQLQQDIKQITDKIEYVTKRRPEQMWMDELKEFEEAYSVYIKRVEQERSDFSNLQQKNIKKGKRVAKK